MAFTEVDFTQNGSTVYRVAATFHENYSGLYILYNAASNPQPVAIVPSIPKPAVGGFALVESSTPAPTFPTPPVLSDQTFWVVLDGKEFIGAARAYGINATSQSGQIILSKMDGQTVAVFTKTPSVCVFRVPFLIDPPPMLLV